MTLYPSRLPKTWALLIGAGLLVLAAILWTPLRRAVEAARFASDVASGQDVMTRPGEAPVRATITFDVAGRTYLGDIYALRGRPPRAAAIAVPGVVAKGKDDPRLVAFATSLARAGFLVLAPDIPNVRALKVGHADANAIADAVSYLASTGTPRKEHSIGLFAFSYAAGPALIAAMKPEARHLVRFVCAVGGYYNVEAAITFLTTGYYRDEHGVWTLGQPSPYAKWVFLVSNAARITDAADRDTVKAIADRKLADNAAEIGDLVAKLGPEGRAVYALISNRDVSRVPELIQGLTEPIRQEIASLDLRTQDFSSLEGRLILLHGRDDTLVPYTESIALAAAASPRARFFLIDSLGHVEPRLSELPDIVKFWQAASGILTERDAMPKPDWALP